MGILTKVTMKEQIARLIQKRIFDQTYQLGQKISILELSQELEVSNSPIREALSLLESEGLVVFTPGVGPKVVDLDEALFNEVQETAQILLLGCFEACIRKGLKQEVIAETEKYLRLQIAAAEGSDRESELQFARWAVAFDICVVEVLGNKTLKRLYAAFFNQLFLVVLYEHQHSDIDRQENIRQHQHIVDALKADDLSAVRRCIEVHFDRKMPERIPKK